MTGRLIAVEPSALADANAQRVVGLQPVTPAPSGIAR
jgi:hypothetical protein